MYTQFSEKFNHSSWDYLDIPEWMIDRRYHWVSIHQPNDNRKYPWAHEYDMVRLFLLCRTFRSKAEALPWITTHLGRQLTSYHLDLVDAFCYSEIKVQESIEDLIENSESPDLLPYIQSVFDRCLLWYDPVSSWPSVFKGILNATFGKMRMTNEPILKQTETITFKGVDLESIDEYTHVFYKIGHLFDGIGNGELYYDLKDLAKQTYGALICSILLMFADKPTTLDDFSWERTMTDILEKETHWCKVKLLPNSSSSPISGGIAH
jgi:hypothetical protein